MEAWKLDEGGVGGGGMSVTDSAIFVFTHHPATLLHSLWPCFATDFLFLCLARVVV